MVIVGDVVKLHKQFNWFTAGKEGTIFKELNSHCKISVSADPPTKTGFFKLLLRFYFSASTACSRNALANSTNSFACCRYSLANASEGGCIFICSTAVLKLSGCCINSLFSKMGIEVF